MAYEFRLDISSPTGQKEAELMNFLSLGASIGVNTIGAMTFEVDADHPAASFLVENSHLDLYFHDDSIGLDWTLFYGGLLRSQIRDYSLQNRISVSSLSYLWYLSTRVIAYHSNYNNRSKFLSLPSETIMKEMVRYNCTGEATTFNGRLLNGNVWPATIIQIEDDEGRGAIQTWYCAQDGLQDSLQELAKIAGGDYDLVPLDTGFYEFRFYPGQLGVDRQSTVIFSVDRGNMGDAVYSESRIGEATVVLVGGQGDDATREFQVRTSSDYSALRHIEVFQPATQVVPGDLGGLNAEGDKKLIDTRATQKFEFELIQTPATKFAKHYNLGDLVTAINPYNGLDVPQKIKTANLTLVKDQAPHLVVKAETP